MITGDSVLHLAVFEDKTEFVQKIICPEEGAHALYELEEINLKNEDGNTSLTYACLKGNLEIVKLLHFKGASMTHKNSAGLTPLLLSIYHQHFFIVHYLLSVETVFESIQTALDLFKCLQFSISSSGGSSSSQIFYLIVEVFEAKIEEVFGAFHP
jgi:hypothetical protein